MPEHLPASFWPIYSQEAAMTAPNNQMIATPQNTIEKINGAFEYDVSCVQASSWARCDHSHLLVTSTQPQMNFGMMPRTAKKKMPNRLNILRLLILVKEQREQIKVVVALRA